MRGWPNSMRSEQGSALLFTMIVTFVLLFLGGALGLQGMVEKRQVQLAEADLQAYYLARSGADAVAQFIIDNPTRFEDLMGKTSERKSLGFGRIFVKVVDDQGIPKIISTGTVETQTRTVTLSLNAVGSHSQIPEINSALFVGGSNTLSRSIHLKGATINGTLTTNLTKEDSIFMDWDVKIKNGGLILGPGGDEEKVVKLNDWDSLSNHVSNNQFGTLEQVAEYPSPSFPKDSFFTTDKVFSAPHDGTTLPSENYYQEINVKENTTLIIDVGNETRNIYVRTLRIEGNIEVTKSVGSNGRLVVYVEDRFSFGHGKFNLNGDSSTLTIYYAGSEPFNLFSNCEIWGNVIVKDAAINFSNSGKLVGNLLSRSKKDIRIDGAAIATNGVIYAPDAKIILDGSASTGAIVSKLLETDGNVSITYPKEPFVESLSPELFDPIGAGSGTFIYSRNHWSDETN